MSGPNSSLDGGERLDHSLGQVDERVDMYAPFIGGRACSWMLFGMREGY